MARTEDTAPTFVSVREAATMAGVAPMTIRRRVTAGELAAYTVGGDRRRTFVKRDDIAKITAPRVKRPPPAASP